MSQIESILQWVKAQIDGMDAPPDCEIEPGENEARVGAQGAANVFLEQIAPFEEPLGNAHTEEMTASLVIEIEALGGARDARRAAILTLAENIGIALRDGLAADPTGGGAFFSLTGAGFSLARQFGPGLGELGGVLRLRATYAAVSEFL